MVLFDYGQTLVGAREHNSLRGRAALMPYLTRNPRGLTAEQIDAFANELFETLCEPVRAMGREIHEHTFLRMGNELLELAYSIPVEEQERVNWAHCLALAPMPQARELLAFLRERGIRTGVVSNFMCSEGELRRRLSETLPEHAFEFVVASSEYGVRKPDPLIFRLTLTKAGLAPGDVWFCGDNVRCDVEGAHAAGMFPVWYDNRDFGNIWGNPPHEPPACPHLHIHDWRELIEILKD